MWLNSVFPHSWWLSPFVQILKSFKINTHCVHIKATVTLIPVKCSTPLKIVWMRRMVGIFQWYKAAQTDRNLACLHDFSVHLEAFHWHLEAFPSSRALVVNPYLLWGLEQFTSCLLCCVFSTIYGGQMFLTGHGFSTDTVTHADTWCLHTLLILVHNLYVKIEICIEMIIISSVRIYVSEWQ